MSYSKNNEQVNKFLATLDKMIEEETANSKNVAGGMEEYMNTLEDSGDFYDEAYSNGCLDTLEKVKKALLGNKVETEDALSTTINQLLEINEVCFTHDNHFIRIQESIEGGYDGSIYDSKESYEEDEDCLDGGVCDNEDVAEVIAFFTDMSKKIGRERIIKMKKIKIEIIETLSTVVEVEAETEEEAENIVRQQYRDSEIVLDSDNYSGADFLVYRD